MADLSWLFKWTNPFPLDKRTLIRSDTHALHWERGTGKRDERERERELFKSRNNGE